MTTQARRPAGRPRAFARDAVLDRAVCLFWRYGYEATSIAALTEGLGVASPSLYATFGNKARLFEAVVDRYAATVTAGLYAPWTTRG